MQPKSTMTHRIDAAMDVMANVTVCHTCLSVNRQLYRIGDKHVKWCHRFFITTQLSANSLLCWECLSVVRKIFKFQSQMQLTLTILNSSYVEDCKSISSLGIVDTTSMNLIDCKHEDREDEKENLADVKSDYDIKCEVDYNDDDDDDDFTYKVEEDNEHDDDDKTDVMQTTKRNCIEGITKTQSGKRKNKRRYKMLFNNLQSLEIDKMTKKIPIELTEMRYWLARETNDEKYKSYKFKCEYCICGWNKEERYLLHKRKHHDTAVGDYICEICQRRFRSKRHISLHMPHHNYVRECLVCAYRAYEALPRAKRMRQHLTTHLRMVQCLDCKETFSSVREFYKHYKCVHAPSVFICDHCQKRCKSKRMMEKHIRFYHSSNDCEVCGNRYKNRNAFMKHYSLHHRRTGCEDSYCVQCDKKFPNNALFRRHLSTSAAHVKERKAEVKKRIACPDCGKEYSRTSYMNNHYRHVHTKQSKYYCQQCDKHFLNRTKYVDHQRYNHNGEQRAKNKLCNICGRGFAATRTLVNHIRTHSGERPFKCNHCEAAFTQKQAMVSHVNYIHMKNKRRR